MTYKHTVTDPTYKPPIIALRHSPRSWEVLATDQQRQQMEAALGTRFVDLDQLWLQVDADQQQLELAARLADARIMINTSGRLAQIRAVARLRAVRDPWIAAQLQDFADLLEVAEREGWWDR